MSQSTVILLVVAALGLAGRNSTVAAAASILLVIHLAQSGSALHFLEEYSLKLGIGLITLSVMIPFATGSVGYQSLLSSFKSYLGLFAIIVGVSVAYLGGRGVALLTSQPQVMVGLLIGTIIGVAFFKGVPVGPLIGAGMVAVLLSAISTG
ncbi:MAG: DUF441 domain-containing protein [Firmicutes bacterium]|nr:DUF441 domain-containing protein [Bacillota bacterium]